jgi:hypothetical protein
LAIAPRQLIELNAGASSHCTREAALILTGFVTKSVDAGNRWSHRNASQTAKYHRRVKSS